MTAYDFSFTAIDGKPMPLSSFKGKAILLVNVASQCGFTPQYTELEALWREMKDAGLVVLGVPSNDFGAQEPGSENEIRNFCSTKFNVTFPMTGKVHVTGAAAHPLYKWIVEELGEDAAPKWNFHKYLVNSYGELVGAWPSRVKPNSTEIRDVIAAAVGG
ncbi:MAG: glutathione peroxidase [Alphaproteobacteria bacterium]